MKVTRHAVHPVPNLCSVFTAQRYAYVIDISVRLSVRPSRCRIVSERMQMSLNCFQHLVYTVHHSNCLNANDFKKNSMVRFQRGAGR